MLLYTSVSEAPLMMFVGSFQQVQRKKKMVLSDIMENLRRNVINFFR